MNINDDGAEIDSADQLTVYGEWIKFVDGEGSTVKIPPFVVKKLLNFALDHIKEFDEGAWDEEDNSDRFKDIDRQAVLTELLPEIERLFGLNYKGSRT